jgi:hypothetical protein
MKKIFPIAFFISSIIFLLLALSYPSTIFRFPSTLLRYDIIELYHFVNDAFNKYRGNALHIQHSTLTQWSGVWGFRGEHDAPDKLKKGKDLKNYSGYEYERRYKLDIVYKNNLYQPIYIDSTMYNGKRFYSRREESFEKNTSDTLILFPQSLWIFSKTFTIESYKNAITDSLFLAKRISFVICTESDNYSVEPDEYVTIDSYEENYLHEKVAP